MPDLKFTPKSFCILGVSIPETLPQGKFELTLVWIAILETGKNKE